MADFVGDDLTGATFERLRLTGARFHDVDLRNAAFEWVDMTGVQIRGAYLVDMDVKGDLRNLVINGVDVAPLIEAELDRRYPGRERMRPVDPDGFRDAWDLLNELWLGTVQRAQSMDPELLHARVAGEWSFVETLRHLVFVTDAWVRRAVLGDPAPWDPLDLPSDETPDEPSVPRDRDARPSLDRMLALRADRMGTVGSLIAVLDDAMLGEMTEPVLEPGYPESTSYSVAECLRTVLDEEWEHRRFAERDLDHLTSSGGT